MTQNFRGLIIRSFFLLVFAVCLCCGSVLLAQGQTRPLPFSDPEKRSLRGLKAVQVLVSLKPEVERQGLTRQQLQKDVERRLGQAGIRTLTIGEMMRDQLFYEVPTLLIMHFVKDLPRTDVPKDVPTEFIGDNVIVKLDQYARLERDPSIELSVATWERTGLLVCPRWTPLQAREVRKRVMDLIDKFINDYVAANP